jgi:phosphoribosylpyrophosphate synthetase
MHTFLLIIHKTAIKQCFSIKSFNSVKSRTGQIKWFVHAMNLLIISKDTGGTEKMY